MEPTTYFINESPDYNFGLWGKPERLAANRAIVCIMTEFGLCNNRRMQAYEVNTLIESLQATTVSFKESKSRVKLKNTYIKERHITKPIRATTPASLGEHTSEGSQIESTS